MGSSSDFPFASDIPDLGLEKSANRKANGSRQRKLPAVSCGRGPPEPTSTPGWTRRSDQVVSQNFIFTQWEGALLIPAHSCHQRPQTDPGLPSPPSGHEAPPHSHVPGVRGGCVSHPIAPPRAVSRETIRRCPFLVFAETWQGGLPRSRRALRPPCQNRPSEEPALPLPPAEQHLCPLLPTGMVSEEA